jgi:PTS system cellobiose-specific IIC component
MKLNAQSIQQKVQPAVNKISANRYLKAIMGGMMAALPATIIGSLATLLKTLPIAPYQSFITSNGIDKYLQLPVTFTTNILALIFVVCIAFSLAESFEEKGLSASVIALISFFIITPIQSTTNAYGQTVGLIPMDWLGATGMFSGIIVALVSARLYVYIVKKGWTIKMPDSVPPFIKSSFASLIPGILITTLFLIIAVIFEKTSYGSMHQFIYSILQVPLTHLGGSIWAMLLVAMIGQILWLFGIHGSMVVFSVMMPIWLTLDTAQLTAYSAGDKLPNVVGFSFFCVYTFAGTAIGLAILMLRAKSERYKALGKLSIVPAFFGITEPLIFGTPLVLNPIFAIPFVFGNVVSLLFAYIATISGIIPPLTGISTPTGTPIVIQGLIAGNWRNAVFQFILLILWIAIWYPFFKIADNKACKEEAGETE